MNQRIDLNADLGESVERWDSGSDVQLLDFVSSANVSTGAYAGTDDLIRETCAAAKSAGVRIGAQVGYPDRNGFGRRPMELSTSQLAAEIHEQLQHLGELASQVGAEVEYVKPHGALYHRVHHDRFQAEGLLAGLLAFDSRLALMGMPGAVSLELADVADVTVIREGFADRAYTADGLLVDRSIAGAVLNSATAAAEQSIALSSRVDSICLHSDSPGVLDFAREIRAALAAAGLEVARP